MAGRNLSFGKVMRKGRGEGYIFNLDDALVWTNGAVIIRNDRNLIGYFGSYVLDRVVEQGRIYCLNTFSNQVTIDREYEVPNPGIFFNRVRKYLSYEARSFNDIDNLEERIIIDTGHKQQHYILHTSKGDLVMVDKDYYEYFAQLGFNKCYAGNTEFTVVLFRKDTETKGILAPLVSSPSEVHEIKGIVDTLFPTI